MGEWMLKIDVPNLRNIRHPLIYWNNSSGIVECFPSIEVIKVINFSSMCMCTSCTGVMACYARG